MPTTINPAWANTGAVPGAGPGSCACCVKMPPSATFCRVCGRRLPQWVSRTTTQRKPMLVVAILLTLGVAAFFVLAIVRSATPGPVYISPPEQLATPVKTAPVDRVPPPAEFAVKAALPRPVPDLRDRKEAVRLVTEATAIADRLRVAQGQLREAQASLADNRRANDAEGVATWERLIGTLTIKMARDRTNLDSVGKSFRDLPRDVRDNAVGGMSLAEPSKAVVLKALADRADP